MASGLAQLGLIVELENDMKTHGTAGLLLCALAAVASAQAPDGKRLQAATVGGPSLVMPISIQDDDHSSAPQLRDVLRQPLDGMQEPGGKPYRLSPEERHRLREQLRSQSVVEQSRGGKP
jgi:hypothetical protein